MNKLLLITYYWPPSGGAGVQRSLKFAKYLPEFGVQPVVLTVDENKGFYPFLDTSLLKDVAPDLRVVKTQSIELLRRFSTLFPKTEVPQSGFAGYNKITFKGKLMHFVRGNLLIPDARVSWVKPAYREAIRLLEEEQIDTYQISSPPHSSQLLGLKLKKRFPHKKWIADLRDPWTDVYFYKELLHTPLAKAIDARYERRVLQQADEIVVVSSGIKELLEAKVPGIASKIHVIPNGYDADDFNVVSRPPQNELLFTYAGTLADTYHPEVVFKVLKQVAEKMGSDNFPLRLLFVGKTTDTIKQLAHTYGAEAWVRYVEYVPHSEIVSYLKNTTGLLLVIPRTTAEKGILTGKLFEYLAAKKPIWAIGPPGGDVDEILRSTGAGQIFSRDQEQEMMAFLEDKIREWKSNPNLDLPDTDSVERFSRRSLTRELSELVRDR